MRLVYILWTTNVDDPHVQHPTHLFGTYDKESTAQITAQNLSSAISKTTILRWTKLQNTNVEAKNRYVKYTVSGHYVVSPSDYKAPEPTPITPSNQETTTEVAIPNDSQAGINQRVPAYTRPIELNSGSKELSGQKTDEGKVPSGWGFYGKMVDRRIYAGNLNLDQSHGAEVSRGRQEQTWFPRNWSLQARQSGITQELARES